MNKIRLIVVREYLSRVRKRAFAIMTILGPILFSAVFFVPMWLAMQGSSDEKIIQLLDEQGLFDSIPEPSGNIKYVLGQANLEKAKLELGEDKYFGLLHIPPIDIDNPQGIRFYSVQNPGIVIQSSVQQKIQSKIEEVRINDFGLKREQLDSLKAGVTVQTINLTEGGFESESSAGGATAIGYIGAFLIYFFIFLYGAQIMRGVIEEKTSRVIEVLIVSVRPFQLMMGKIIGVAGVGLTQFLLWVTFSFTIILVAQRLFLGDVNPDQIEQNMIQTPAISAETSESQEILLSSLDTLEQFNLPYILACFIFYFLSGYLFYAALFAAVGSAVDSDADSQQFMFPITIPLILSITMMSGVIQDPHSSLSFWLSVIPFTSPVIMMMRLPFDVPVWQLVLSMIMLIIGFCGTTWVASRIYRVGIFMHGTKVSYKTLAKWFMMKN